MPQSLSRVLIHTVFSTKERKPFLNDSELRQEMHSHLGGCAKALDCFPVRVGGVVDHVHLLTTLSRTISVSEFVKEIKRNSTHWVKKQKALSEFAGQSGYGCFSVSESQRETVVRYVEQQEEHHRTMTFQEEYREFLRRHGQEWDERYVWD